MLNSDNAEEFVAKIQDDFPDLSESNLTIAVDTTGYDAMSSSIESVGSFATTILVIVIVRVCICLLYTSHFYCEVFFKVCWSRSTKNLDYIRLWIMRIL